MNTMQIVVLIMAGIEIVGGLVLCYVSNKQTEKIWDEVYEKVLAERILENRKAHQEEA